MEVITLCGSTKFEEKYHEMNRKLTLDGNVVFSCGVFEFGSAEKEKNRETLSAVHRKKIDLSDSIMVLNVDGYIGKHTAEEIKYAKSKGKNVLYLEG